MLPIRLIDDQRQSEVRVSQRQSDLIPLVKLDPRERAHVRAAERHDVRVDGAAIRQRHAAARLHELKAASHREEIEHV